MAEGDKDELPGLSPEERELVKKLLGSPLDFPSKFLDWVIKYIENNPPVLPISQIFGFTQFVATFEQVPAADSTTSTTYADLSGGANPELTELPKGRYLLLYGASLSNSAGAAENYVSVSVNGAAASDNDSGLFGSTGTTQASVVGATVKDLDQDSNTVTVKYRQSGGITMTARRRWLIALKIANI